MTFYVSYQKMHTTMIEYSWISSSSVVVKISNKAALISEISCSCCLNCLCHTSPGVTMLLRLIVITLLGQHSRVKVHQHWSVVDPITPMLLTTHFFPYSGKALSANI